MKKCLTSILLTCTLLACSNHKPTENKNAANPIESDDDNDGGATGKLILNDGAKWKVDTGTNNNVNSIRLILKKFDIGADKSLTAYQHTGYDLQQGIDKLIRECKMKGPDHEALHEWLGPLIALVTKFKQAPAVADAGRSLSAVGEQVNLYPQYFEL
jgi:hypothetical protein